MMYYDSFYQRQTQPSGNSYILSYAQGDVNGDYVPDYVYLVGQRSPDSPYTTDITLVIQDGKTQLFYSVPLKTNEGYQPSLFLGDFTGNKVNDIYIRMDSGGSGGFGYFYVYSFLNNQPAVLFDYERFDDLYVYSVIYQDQYRVKVTNQTLGLTFTIDLSNRGDDYLAEIYNPDGTLISSLEGSVLGLNQLYPIDFNGDGIYELYALQRIIGRYSADGLGLVQTPLQWDGERFKSFIENQYVAVLGQPLNP
ncbi:VCBS repeat-containing protein [Halobacillus mangrovi]|uniref:VCBS repeat-containing protein n=1 Tax=Halobacillus mangrovi TaxID=402384 RepID=UPI003D98753B